MRLLASKINVETPLYAPHDFVMTPE